MERARRSTHTWIDSGGPARPHPQRFLSLHSHTTVTDATRGHAA